MNPEEVNKKELISYRAGKPGDINFIYATWLKGLYYGNTLFADIPQDLYFTVYHQVIEALLKKPEVCVCIACLKDDEDTVLGYSVVEGNTLHWMFIKAAWRKIGLGKDLLPKPFVTITHYSKMGRDIWKKKYPAVTFNPFLK